MARTLEIVRRGFRAWNVWRIKNLGARNLPEADLSWTDLHEVDLHRANLHGANLEVTDLHAANLEGINFQSANLYLADLQGANLQGADIYGAYLRGANLQGADLQGADLQDVYLKRAELQGANLSGANLTWADFTEAKLQRTRFQGADLQGVNFQGAELQEGDFRGASLRGANLCGANLQGADFHEATIGATNFANVDLRVISGLESVEHHGPSTIGIDTLIKSNGQIPEPFLRGCGVPDSWIEQLPALIGSVEPIQFYSCFISYSTKDETFAKRLHERMRRENLRVWFAPEDLKGGHKLRDQLHSAIQLYDKFLLILSDASMASDWVADEVSHAYARERKEQRRILFPIGLSDFDSLKHWSIPDDDTGRDLAKEVRRYYIPDFSTWKDNDAFEAAFARLLNNLKANDAVLPKL